MDKKSFSLALVTGASSGIGEALARLLASKGIPLIISGRNVQALKQLQETLPVEVEICQADLAIPLEREKLVNIIRSRGPDLVVNNAGIGLYGFATSHPPGLQLEMVEVNNCALIEITLEAASELQRKGGSGVILNVSSVAAFQIFPKNSVYAATKAFVNLFSRSLDEELKGEGIRVLASCPGMVTTAFSKRAARGEMERKKRPGFLKMTPEFAAEQIWWQIQRRKPVHVFDWKYRILTFLTQHVFPTSLIGFLLRRSI